MSIYRLSSTEDIQDLLEHSETGMGYQVIRARLDHVPSSKYYVAYNSELLIEMDEFFENNLNELKSKGFEQTSIYANETRFSLGRVFEEHELNEIPLYHSGTWNVDFPNMGRHKGGRGAKENPKERASGFRTYVRLSAYENDRRVDMDRRRLLPGTYTTTEEDYIVCVNFYDEPIDRYALPNEERIEWAFKAIPEQGDIVQHGIVQPNFGHKGGGVEAFFEYGTSSGIFLVKNHYGS